MGKINFNDLPEAVSNIADEIKEIKQLLLEQKNLPQPEHEQLLTIQEASEVLCLSIPTLYGYVHRAEIPVFKKAKRLYFSKKDLLDWIKQGRKKTSDELEMEANKYLLKKKNVQPQ